MKLLLDLGNSQLKWAASTQSHTLNATTSVAYSIANWVDALHTQWQTLISPETVAISCVSHPQRLSLVVNLAQSLWPDTEIFIPTAQAQALGVRNSYAQPEKLGIDRWLALLAVKALCTQAACVVDCGTAITLDVLDAEGLHLGGLIIPGLKLMQQSLAANTEQLTYSQQTYPLGLAKHTSAALYSGSIYAAVGLITTVINQLPYPVKLFLTGGDAPTLASALPIESQLEAQLVLQGLLALCLNKRKKRTVA